MSKTIFWIVATGFYLLLLGLGVYLFGLSELSYNIQDNIIQYSLLVVTGFGFVIAIYQVKTYIDDIKRKANNYLDLNVNVNADKEYIKIKTQVLNNSGKNQGIYYAFILISMQNCDVLDIGNRISELSGHDIRFTESNKFYKFKDFILQPKFIENQIAIVPLTFYFNENIRISNENPTFSYTFNNKKKKLKKGIYSVRFFVFPSRFDLYHRSTVDALVIK